MEDLLPRGLMRPGAGVGSRGPAVSTGGGAYSPAEHGALAAWHDASDTDTITVVADEMTAWADKGPNGVDLIAPVVSRRPPYGAKTINSVVVPDFTGSPAQGEVMWADTATSHQILNASDGTVTFMAVCRLEDISDSNNIISTDGESVTRGSIMRVNHRPEGLFFRTGESTIVHSQGSTFSDNAIGVATMVLTTSTVRTWWNNAGAAATSYTGAAAPTFATGYALGGTAKAVPDGNLDGQIAEAIAWSEALSDANRQAAERILAVKWGLSTTPWD